MNRFARLATRLLDAPRAVVWVADADGGPGTWESWPAASPSDEDLLAGCRRVAELGCPAAWRISEDRPSAFAGVPLVGPGGELLGVLAVADSASRRWTPDDLRDLGDLAAACSAQMRLRYRSEAALRDREQAEAAAALAEVAADRMEVLLSRAQLLLRAAEDLGETTGPAEVRARVGDLVSGDLKPSYVGLVLVGEDGRLHRAPAPGGEGAASAEAGAAYGLEAGDAYGPEAGWPTARAVREGRTVVVEDPQALRDGYAPEAVAAFGHWACTRRSAFPCRASRPSSAPWSWAGTSRTRSARRNGPCCWPWPDTPPGPWSGPGTSTSGSRWPGSSRRPCSPTCPP
ncbi:GAF domain-containing protein [Streptomyces sp. cmx-4-9]|uniref:GAF domain-containing protein n=1 Tax=Streptomyces sp. cmx-4-9 TaxID=2790941 RepID=UPI003980CC3F